jgi:hypothetical protein
VSSSATSRVWLYTQTCCVLLRLHQECSRSTVTPACRWAYSTCLNQRQSHDTCMLLCLQWPGCLEGVKPPNAGLRLFGGAAFERCLNEFQVAANMLAFPSGGLQAAMLCWCAWQWPSLCPASFYAQRHMLFLLCSSAFRQYSEQRHPVSCDVMDQHRLEFDPALLTHLLFSSSQPLQLPWRVTAWQMCCWRTRARTT